MVFNIEDAGSLIGTFDVFPKLNELPALAAGVGSAGEALEKVGSLLDAGEELVRADLVVGWNHMQFDYPVLQPYVFHTLAEQTINLDMMLELEKIVGFRLKLDSVASASLGTGKTADGLDALRWWQEHKKSGQFEPLRKIAEYCAFDVKVTKCVHEYALEHGLLKYDDKSGRIAEVAVDWK